MPYFLRPSRTSLLAALAVTVLGKKYEVSELVFTRPLNTGVIWFRSGNNVVRCAKYEHDRTKPFAAWRDSARAGD